MHSAQINAAKPESTINRDLLRRELQKKRLAAIRRSSLTPANFPQRVAHHHAGNFSLMEKIGHARAQHIHIPNQRRRLHPVRVHVAAQFRNLPRVEADLVDDELRAALDFLPQLFVLRNDLALAQLEVGRHRADRELRLLQLLAFSIAVAAPSPWFMFCSIEIRPMESMSNTGRASPSLPATG